MAFHFFLVHPFPQLPFKRICILDFSSTWSSFQSLTHHCAWIVNPCSYSLTPKQRQEQSDSKSGTNPAESPFCPTGRRSGKLNNSKLILLLHSHHILSYRPTAELFSCLYLWGMQALLRAAPVWSIIKYDATWKCIRHETRVWTSHSDFLLVTHFVWDYVLTAAVFIFEHLFFKTF